jgi:hypothetical protein
MKCRFDIGFMLTGPVHGTRQLVHYPSAFSACAELDPRIDAGLERYLSAFTYTEDMVRHVERTGSVKGYHGPCGGDFVWIDIDGDLDDALAYGKRLALLLTGPLAVEPGDLLLFFSGAKGFHIGVPAHGLAEPSPTFPAQARAFAERLAVEADVKIDTKIYDAVRCFRAPNSRHPRTGLYKRWLSADGFERMNIGQILELATAPETFEVPEFTGALPQALQRVWNEANPPRPPQTMQLPNLWKNTAACQLNRATLDFIHAGAEQGERATRLFAAAANLGELAAAHGPQGLATALLEVPGRDSGLTPSEVRRQIETGWKHGYEKGARP